MVTPERRVKILDFGVAKLIRGPDAVTITAGSLTEQGVDLVNFAVLDRGIYYIDRVSGGAGIHYLDRSAGVTRLRYFDLTTLRSTTILSDLGNVDTPLTVSGDGRTVLYPRRDSAIDQLMLVENFR